MAYNPGIAARGEILGQSIGAAGQNIAQQYSQGLQLQEEQKRYNKKEKQRKKDRRFIEDSNIKRAGILAEQIFDDEGTVTAFKETIEGWEAADVAGWIAGQTESMKMQAQQGTIAFQALQLKELEREMAQDPVMREAMADMTMYQTEQNLSPMDALNSTVQQNPDLSPTSRLKLNQLVQARQTMDYNAQSLQLKGLASETDRINAETNAGNARLNQRIFDEGQTRRAKGAQVHPIPGVESSTVVEFPSGQGTRSQVVQTGVDDDPEITALGPEGTKITTGVDSIIDHLDEAIGGDDRYWLNIWSRQGKASTLIKEIGSKNREYRLKNGQDHPDYIRLKRRAAPFINKMKNSSDETNRKLAIELAAELEIQID
jgi:hypothetical protein